MTITQRRQLQRATAIRALESVHVRQNREQDKGPRAFGIVLVVAIVAALYFLTGG